MSTLEEKCKDYTILDKYFQDNNYLERPCTGKACCSPDIKEMDGPGDWLLFRIIESELSGMKENSLARTYPYLNRWYSRMNQISLIDWPKTTCASTRFALDLVSKLYHDQDRTTSPLPRSLRTLDCVVQGSLLSSPNHSSSLLVAPTPIQNDISIINDTSNKGSSTTFINLLSKQECLTIRKQAHTRYGFSPLKNVYDSKTRDCNRLCIIDTNLSTLLWNRLKPVLSPDLMTTRPTLGFDCDGDWKAIGINSCVRLSRYDSPSIGFVPHYDTPYIETKDCRSIYSLVIYLNDDFGGGETALYTLTNSVPNGLTTSQELYLSETALVSTIVPKMGKCVVFPHDTLHAGLPVTNGTKIILRTDIVYERVSTDNKKNNHSYWSTKETKRVAIATFLAAQRAELAGYLKISGDLYESSLSMRRILQTSNPLPTTTTTRITKVNVFNVLDGVLGELIFDSSTPKELAQLSTSSKRTHVLVKQYNMLYISKQAIRQRPSDSPGRANDDLIPRYPYIPTLYDEYQTTTVFKYNNVGFVDSNLQHCLRVLAAYTLYGFGRPKNEDSIVVKYDPSTGVAQRTSLAWLLTCVFYNHPCETSLYHVYSSRQFDMHRPHFLDTCGSQNRKRFEKGIPLVSETYDNCDERFKDTIKLTSRIMYSSPSYRISTNDNKDATSLDIDYIKDESSISYKNPSNHEEKSGDDTDTDDETIILEKNIPRLVQAYVDPTVPTHMMSSVDGVSRTIDESKEKNGYTQVNVIESGTFHWDYPGNDNCEDCVSMSPEPGTQVRESFNINNKIIDFSSELITIVDPSTVKCDCTTEKGTTQGHWIALIEDNTLGFHQAGSPACCYAGYGAAMVSETDRNIQIGCRKSVHHIHIYRHDDGMTFYCRYNAVTLL
jgi:hypothetical protein